MDPTLQHFPLPILLAAANNSEDPLLNGFSLSHDAQITASHTAGHLNQSQPGSSTSDAHDFAPQGMESTDEDGDKHVIARGLARLPEEYSQSDLELLFRTLANEFTHRTVADWSALFEDNQEEIHQIVRIIADSNLSGNGSSTASSHYSYNEEELLVNFYAAGGPSSSSNSPLSWKSFANEHPSRTHDAWRMYGKRNRVRLEDRIQSKREELKRRGITIETSSADGDIGASTPQPKRRSGKRRSWTTSVGDDEPNDSGDVDDEETDREMESPQDGQKSKRRRTESLQSTPGEGSNQGRRSKRTPQKRNLTSRRGSKVIPEPGLGLEIRGADVPTDNRSLTIPNGHDYPLQNDQDLHPEISPAFHDRLLLVQLLAQCGPNPSPSDWLAFGEMHPQYSVEGWLRLASNPRDRDMLLKEAELIRPTQAHPSSLVGAPALPFRVDINGSQ